MAATILSELPTPLRRWRSCKKILYAAVILLLTIFFYASTSTDDNSPDVVEEWRIPTALDETIRVDRALMEPLHRLPLGPFEDHPVPVIIETLNLKIPTFNASHPNPTSASKSALKPLAVIPAAAGAPPKPVPNPQIVNQVPAAGDVAQKPPVVQSAVVKSPSVSNASAAKQPQKAPSVNPHAMPPPPPPPSKPLPNLTGKSLEMVQRISHTKAQCDKYKFPHEVDADVYVLAKYNMSYCKVPKSGSTYWEQVFSYLSKIPKELAYLRIKSPFQISKYDIRYTSHFNLPRHNWKMAADKTLMMKTNRILFVRHPLERLWSSYIEKFYLIDFWSSIGLQIKSKGNADVNCPKAISFREFVEFTLPIFNEYWAPTTELCNPCTFKPTYIGHIETMREDSLFILRQSNLQWIFVEQEKISRAESHMIDMIIYNYQIHSIQWYSFFHRCFSQKDLAFRLWDVFRKVGYLSSHAILPDNLPDYNQTTIIKELKTQAAKFPLDAKNGRAQQLKIITREYQALPKPIMAKLLEKYAMDFELFGYNTQLPTS